jgi:hypothetical protein
MRISIAGKVVFVLLLIFSSVLVGITAHQAYRERRWRSPCSAPRLGNCCKPIARGLDSPAARAVVAAHEALRQYAFWIMSC